MTNNKKASAKRCLIVIISVFLIFCCASAITTKIIYDSIFLRFDNEIPIPSELEGMVDSRESMQYPSGDNMLTGYLYKTGESTDKDTLIIIAPGFGSGADSYLWQISSLTDMGWSVFAFDSTGSFASEGESSVGFSQELIDLKSTISYIENNNRFGYNNIVIIGHSRGGYAACCVLEYDFDIAAVISISGVNSAMEGIICSAEDYVGPLAYGNYGFLWLYQASIFGSEVTNLSAHKSIEKSDVPVLIVHGSNDKTVPIDKHSIFSHKSEITSKNAEFLIWDEVGETGHLDLLFDSDGRANKELMTKINEFLIKSIY